MMLLKFVSINNDVYTHDYAQSSFIIEESERYLATCVCFFLSTSKQKLLYQKGCACERQSSLQGALNKLMCSERNTSGHK